PCSPRPFGMAEPGGAEISRSIHFALCGYALQGLRDFIKGEKMTGIFLVCVGDAESMGVKSAHRTYEGALKAWDKERLSLLDGYLKRAKETKDSFKDRYLEMAENMRCDDPNSI